MVTNRDVINAGAYRKNYPPGTRVVARRVEDENGRVEPGTEGTVIEVTDQGGVLVEWDDNSNIVIYPSQHSFRVVD